MATRIIYLYHSAVNIGLQHPEANTSEKLKFHRRFKSRNGICCISSPQDDLSDTESVISTNIQITEKVTVEEPVTKPKISLQYHIFSWIWWWPVFIWLEKHSTQPVLDFEVQPLLLISKSQVQSSFSQRRSKLGYKKDSYA